MMELLLRHSYPRNGTLADQAFITGIMSMMPTALGLPMHEIFEQIALETSVMEALTSHAGVLGKTLALLECFDADDSQGCMHIFGQLPEAGLSLGTLNSCLVESLRWVNGSTEDR